MYSSISAVRSSKGVKRMRDSASLVGVMRPLRAGMAGAAAIRKPAVVKATERAKKDRKRRSLDCGDLAVMGGAAARYCQCQYLLGSKETNLDLWCKSEGPQSVVREQVLNVVWK